MTETPTDRIRGHIEAARTAVLADLDAIVDPVEREAAARDVVKVLLPELGQAVKAHRARTVAELKVGRTLAQLGELLGGLSTARVDQLLKGK